MWWDCLKPWCCLPVGLRDRQWRRPPPLADRCEDVTFLEAFRVTAAVGCWASSPGAAPPFLDHTSANTPADRSTRLDVRPFVQPGNANTGSAGQRLAGQCPPRLALFNRQGIFRKLEDHCGSLHLLLLLFRCPFKLPVWAGLLGWPSLLPAQ